MGETTEAKTLLLTRPEAQSRAFLAQLEAVAGPMRHVISPLFELRPTGAPVPPTGEIVLTSGRAVEALEPGVLAGRRAWCVGPRTAAMAREAGAEIVGQAADAAGLRVAMAAAGVRAAVHLRGDHVAGDLALPGLNLEEIRVYESKDRPLTPEASRLLAGTGAVLAPVFSPRSARLLAQAAGTSLGRLTVVAISAAAAAPVAGAARVTVAPRPDGAAMQSVVLSLWRDLP